MKKKFLSLFLAAVCITGAMSLTACDKGNGENGGSGKYDDVIAGVELTKPAIPSGALLWKVKNENVGKEYSRIEDAVQNDNIISYSACVHRKSTSQVHQDTYVIHSEDKTYNDVNYTTEYETVQYSDYAYNPNNGKPYAGLNSFRKGSNTANYDKIPELNRDQKYEVKSSAMLDDNKMYGIMDDNLIYYNDTAKQFIYDSYDQGDTTPIHNKLINILSEVNGFGYYDNSVQTVSIAIDTAVNYENQLATGNQAAVLNTLIYLTSYDPDYIDNLESVNLDNYFFEVKSSNDKFYAKLSFTITETINENAYSHKRTEECEYIIYCNDNPTITKDNVPSSTKVKPENYKTELTKNILIIDGDGEKIYQDLKDGKTVTIDVFGSGDVEKFKCVLYVYRHGEKIYTPVNNKITIDGSELTGFAESRHVKLYSTYEFYGYDRTTSSIINYDNF